MTGKVAAGFVIFKRFSGNIEYLLLQTSYGIYHWTPPKGHTDPGESEMVTAFRETEEESGLKKEDLKIFENCRKVLTYEVKGKPKTVYYWLAELVNPNAQVKLSDEHQAFKWLDIKEACKLAEFEEMQETLIHCDQYINTVLK